MTTIGTTKCFLKLCVDLEDKKLAYSNEDDFALQMKSILNGSIKNMFGQVGAPSLDLHLDVLSVNLPTEATPSSIIIIIAVDSASVVAVRSAITLAGKCDANKSCRIAVISASPNLFSLALD
eukprot:TRINITY_DN621_c0_g3_i1.p1 TRINITY_DN621_c0_g3~~TRINITY_DN621_c0_g3_i1.p1  ORF type:complete len:122 (-),score=15.31 TRINITY_DN621_c0_g3_i1:532-897(-)